MTEDQRCHLLADYIDGVKDVVLAQQYGCHRGYPSKLAARTNVRRRRTRSDKRGTCVTARLNDEALKRLQERAAKAKTSLAEQVRRSIIRDLADA
jgi:hypothetical protein